jgi:hypothetical protein
MDLRPSFSLILSAFGVDAIVTIPDGSPVPTRIVWMSPTTVEFPKGTDYRRVEEQRVVSIPKSEVPGVPCNTVISAPEFPGAGITLWRVDSIDKVDFDHTRVIVLPVSE